MIQTYDYRRISIQRRVTALKLEIHLLAVEEKSEALRVVKLRSLFEELSELEEVLKSTIHPRAEVSKRQFNRQRFSLD
jgi:hypothetical protein